MSVWVEMTNTLFAVIESRSRSTWACELKFAECVYPGWGRSHAPRERVSWNTTAIEPLTTQVCHAPRERVSWNWQDSHIRIYGWVTLHVSVWVEMPTAYNRQTSMSSRSTWACELKYLYLAIQNTDIGHAPRERVSWNLCRINSRLTWLVTLHVSVWVNFRFNAGLIDIE